MTAAKNRPHAVALKAPAVVRDNPRAAQLAFEVAFKYYTPEELQQQFDLTLEQYTAITRDPTFVKAVQAYRREIDETGADFKVKARKLAFVVLGDLAVLAQDITLEPKDRIDAIREISRLAGYGLKEEGAGGAAPAFALQIVLNPATGAVGTTIVQS